jgi:hypothetical protein
VLDGTANKLARNHIADNGDNVNLTGDNNTVTQNLVTNATGGGFGISVEGGSGNLIANNNVMSERPLMRGCSTSDTR